LGILLFFYGHNAKDVSCCKSEVPSTNTPPKVENEHVNENEDSESNSLLPPKMGCQGSQEKMQRKVTIGFWEKERGILWLVIHGK
jgi:hypothetical protein